MSQGRIQGAHGGHDAPNASLKYIYMYVVK